MLYRTTERLGKAINLLVDEFSALLAERTGKNQDEIKKILRMIFTKIESDDKLKRDFIIYGFLTGKNYAKSKSIEYEIRNIIENSKALNHLHARIVPDETGNIFGPEIREDLTLIELKNELMEYISKKPEPVKPLYEVIVAENLISFVRATAMALEERKIEVEEGETLEMKIDFRGMAEKAGLSEKDLIENLKLVIDGKEDQVPKKIIKALEKAEILGWQRD